MRVLRTIVALAAPLAGALAFAGPARALEPGVFLDPGSPAGKEYSDPFAVSRGQAVGHTAPQGAAQPLFGVGIAPGIGGAQGATSAQGASSAQGGAGAHGSKVPSGVGGRGHDKAGSRPTRVQQAAPARNPTVASLIRPGSSLPEVALVTVLVLVAGVVLGTGLAVLRRRGD